MTLVIFLIRHLKNRISENTKARRKAIASKAPP